MLPYRDMIATLFYFIFNITQTLFAQVFKYLRQDEFERIIARGAHCRLVGVLYRHVFVITDVKSRAVTVTTILRSIAVDASLVGYVFLRASDGGNHHETGTYVLN